MEGFYGEAALFTEGDLHGNIDAARRYYTQLNDIGGRGNWDVARIVNNKDGDRWRALIISAPPGVEESRSAVRDLCRVELPPAPLVALNSDGSIADPALRRLLDPLDRELPPAAAAGTTQAP